MNYNTQNAKIASITEKTLIVGIDVGSETHYARAFNWRNYEYSKKPFAFSNDEAGFSSFVPAVRHLLQHSRWSARRIDVLCGDEGKKVSVKRVEIVIYWERKFPALLE